VCVGRDYKKARQAYEWKLEKQEMRKRRAEAAARAEKVKEERRQRESERKEAKRREERRMLAVAEGCQLYVGGLAIRCDDEALRAHFARFGAVSDALVIREADTGLSRGFGFVTLTDTEKAKEAVKACHGREAKGLCPQHGRMQVRLASKSKAQQEFEARRAKAAAPKPPKLHNGAAAASNGGGGTDRADTGPAASDGAGSDDEAVAAADGGDAAASDAHVSNGVHPAAAATGGSEAAAELD
jgi:hypothetical protein